MRMLRRGKHKYDCLTHMSLRTDEFHDRKGGSGDSLPGPLRRRRERRWILIWGGFGAFAARAATARVGV